VTTPAAPPARFHVRQKITPMQNTYRVFVDDGKGEPGALVAFAKQKRMAFKESFTLYADERASRPVLTIKANRKLDISSTMTVTDPTTGRAIGQLRKRAGASIVRSTWELDEPGHPVVTVQERSMAIAVLRRVWGLIPFLSSIPVPWVFHFDGATANGQQVLTHTRLWGIRDRYVLEVSDTGRDARLAIALAICLDALQGR
jgi:uncharacterized protein YxjI